MCALPARRQAVHEDRPEDRRAVLLVRETSEVSDEQLHPYLSSFERDVLTLQRAGKTRREVARKLRRPWKSIDAALQRIEQKRQDLESGAR
jgi:DNA-binding NarL/FixJ family response regulator